MNSSWKEVTIWAMAAPDPTVTGFEEPSVQNCLAQSAGTQG